MVFKVPADRRQSAAEDVCSYCRRIQLMSCSTECLRYSGSRSRKRRQVSPIVLGLICGQ